jgi:glycosyltransferase involved in cell wall biosynthesis
MKEALAPLISVLTATYNAEKFLPELIKSLENQTDTEFHWIVADGGSSDGTIELLKRASKSIPGLILDSRPDNGISDAINRAMKLATSDYYIIVGADDLLNKDAIYNFKRALKQYEFPDVLAATVVGSNGVTLRPRWPNWVWLYGSPAKVASTSVGTAYKRELNKQIGFFDTRYRIYADGLFMLKLIRRRASICHADFVAGVFFIGGISNSNPFLIYTEELRAKLACGYNVYIQVLVFSIKLIRAHLRHNLKDV